MALEVVGDVAAEVTGQAIRGGLGVEDDEGVDSPGTRDFVTGIGDFEEEELVAFVDGPKKEWVEGLRRRGRSRGSSDCGDFGCGQKGGAIVYVEAGVGGGVQEVCDNLYCLVLQPRMSDVNILER